MARKKNYRDSVQAGLDVVKRGGDQPPWWNVGIVLAGVVFAALYGWQLMTAGDTPGPTPPVAVGTSDTEPPPEPTEEPTGAPADPGAETVNVPGTVSGTTHTVDREAVAVAEAALRGFYSVDAAQQVPTADGREFPIPPTTYPGVTFGELRVQQASDDRVTFVGTADPDGNGPSDAVVHPVAVTQGPDGWGYVPN